MVIRASVEEVLVLGGGVIAHRADVGREDRLLGLVCRCTAILNMAFLFSDPRDRLARSGLLRRLAIEQVSADSSETGEYLLLVLVVVKLLSLMKQTCLQLLHAIHVILFAVCCIDHRLNEVGIVLISRCIRGSIILLRHYILILLKFLALVAMHCYAIWFTN